MEPIQTAIQLEKLSTPALCILAVIGLVWAVWRIIEYMLKMMRDEIDKRDALLNQYRTSYETIAKNSTEAVQKNADAMINVAAALTKNTETIANCAMVQRMKGNQP